MYSDDDLVSDDPDVLQAWDSWPYLHAYDELQATSIRLGLRCARKVDTDRVASIASVIGDVRRWRVYGFFESVQGSFTGSLDLSGRHPMRILPLLTTWLAYATDFFDLSRHVKATVSEELDWRGVLGRVARYTFDDENIFTDFEKKWKIPSSFGYASLLEHTRITVTIMSQFHRPCLQQLCLMHLPPELLDLVFSHASLENARILSSTCHRLREIGQRFIYHKRSLSFDLPEDWCKNLAESSLDEQRLLLTKFAYSSREKVLSTCEFLLGRPDLLDRVHNLGIRDGWRIELSLGLLDTIQPSILDDGGFYAPIYTAFRNIVGASHNLTSITLMHITLDLPMVRSICDLSRLHTLDLRFCRLSFDVQGILVSNVEMAPSSPVYNLRIWVPQDQVPNVWYTLLLCPQLRTLSTQASLGADIAPPPPDVWSRCRFFDTLESLYLGHISLATALPFAAWLSTAAQQPGLRLTHVKLHTNSGNLDRELLIFLRLLQPAPLRVLSVDGLISGDLAFFNSVSQLFPNLEGLTLSRRASNRQRRTWSVKWPHPEWQYAQRLAAFTQLQHFGWNNTPDLSYSPLSLLSLEEGFAEEDKLDLGEWIEARCDDGFCEEGDWSPVLFAIHCPTLRTFSEGSTICASYISRTSEGIVVTRDPTPPNGAPRYDWRQWNPPEMEGYWPPVFPEGS